MRLRAQEQVGSEPYVDVKWKHRVGVQPQYTMISEQLTDRTTVAANVANGNLVLQEADQDIAGRGLNQTVSRYFNNLDVEGGDGNLGFAWNSSTGWDVWAAEYAGGTVVRFDGPSGFNEPFYRKPDGSYTSPTGLNMTLEKHSGGSFTLTSNKSQEKMHFPCNFCSIGWQKDKNGNQINFEYNGPDGKLSKITDTRGRATIFAYNGSGYVSSMTDSTGRVWSYGYSGNKLTSYTNPDNKTTTYGYDSALNLAQITDPRGNATKLTYDSDYRVKTIKRVTDTAADTGPTWSFDYRTTVDAPCDSNHAGKTVVTDPRGKLTTYCWDRELRVTKVKDPNGHERDNKYTPNSDVEQFNDGTGTGSVLTKFSYASDGTNNLTGGESPAGEKFSLDYGDTRAANKFNATRFESPQGTSTRMGYDANGNVTSVKDGKDPDPSTAEVTIARNTDGQPSKVTDKKGNETAYSYNTLGELTTITPEAPLGATTFTYDGLSRVRTVKDGNGKTTTIDYDALDRTKKLTFNDGSVIEYVYDNNGNQTSRWDSKTAQTFGYGYDKLNRRIQETRPGSSITDYVYDPIGNLTRLTDSGGQVDYTYDDGNRLKTIKAPGETTATTYDYNERSTVKKITFPNGVTTDQLFDDSDKVKEIWTRNSGGTTLMKRNYTYKDAQNRETTLRQTESTDEGRTRTFGYDSLDRLKQVTERNSSTQALIHDWLYDYDAASNRTKQTADGNVTTYAYNDANQLCWRASGTPTATCGSPPSGAIGYSYDGAGNLLSSGEPWSGSYNDRNQTTSVTGPSGSTQALEYAGPNQLEWTKRGGNTFGNDLLGLARETSGGGLAEYLTRTPDGTPIGEREANGANRTYAHPDALGSTSAVTDGSGTKVGGYTYDPYGNFLTASPDNSTFSFRFAGQYRSTSLSLYKMGLRWYDPKTGRFTQVDPLDQSSDLREGNRYGYVAGDPVNGTDPTGTHLATRAGTRATCRIAPRHPSCRAGTAANRTAQNAATFDNAQDFVVTGACGLSVIASRGISGAITGACTGYGFGRAMQKIPNYSQD